MKANSGESVFKRDAEVQQKLDQLKGEFNKLNELRIATDRDKKNLEVQLETLREKAMREYGTSDVEELRNLLEQRRMENERMVEEYREHISRIKNDLQEIDKSETSEE